MARILVVDDGSPILAWLRDPLTDGMHFGITARNGQHRRQGRNAEKREGRSVVLCQNGVYPRLTGNVYVPFVTPA